VVGSCQSRNDPAGSAIDDAVVRSTSSSSFGRRLADDVAQLSVNESPRYRDDVRLEDFAVFDAVDGLATSGHQHHHHHHRQHEEQEQQKRHEERPSRIPRPHAVASRRSSTVMTSDTVPEALRSPQLTASSAFPFPPCSKRPSATSPVSTPPSQPRQSTTTVTTQQATEATSSPPVTKIAGTKRPGPDTTISPAAAGKPLRSQRHSTSTTWETHQTLADLWTEFQQPTSSSTS